MTDIKNYEGLYAITSCGKVWSYRSQKFLSPWQNNDGYLLVDLSKDGQKKHCLLHRLVAEAYIPNPDNKPEVNHKDEIKEHCWLNNLEWCDSVYNNNYGNHKKAVSKTVYCVELDKTFESTREAARELGINGNHISCVCRGVRKTCGGFHWRYVNEQ